LEAGARLTSNRQQILELPLLRVNRMEGLSLNNDQLGHGSLTLALFVWDLVPMDSK
jgi:hypothetical protein